ncbi:lipase secretion chaperone [Rhodoferax sp. TBRC 17660]|uniref:Lipase helper protein n=1 Tax=Rhodoferax potami TaxID=3068338 RepID=A0ABU3KLK7_9BURK|nr:lipase secretion chaperone [Rhodoferax sp. TBRC 17660]MDT7518248.1 lipase secretion chaperone [Rhodoferax sp. TBRC 17660]
MRLRSKALAGLAGLALLGGWGADMWLWGDSPTGDHNASSGAIATGPARSLQGTAPDGLHAVQTMGLHALPTQCREAGCTVLPYAELKRLFDYYLSTVGELSVEEIGAQIRTVLAQNLKPVQLPQAERLLERYLSFKKALVVVEQQFAKTPPGNAVLRERFEAMRVVRARFFSAEEAQAMFGAEDLHDLDALARLDIVNDAQLSPQDKQARLAALDKQLPPACAKTGRRHAQSSSWKRRWPLCARPVQGRMRSTAPVPKPLTVQQRAALPNWTKKSGPGSSELPATWLSEAGSCRVQVRLRTLSKQQP